MTRDLDLASPGALLASRRVERLLRALAAPGEETRIVGGAVRNALLGREVTEIDLATTAPPPDTMRRAASGGLKAIPTGIEHGTVTVVVEGRPFEVTTLREDVETDGRHAVVRFGRDFERDALRRDFTINALSVGPDGAVQDYTGGLQDLADRRVRFIGEARQRIREDYLRVLRFFRFSAEYADGALDGPGLAAAIGERDGLDRLSRERVRAELLKLVVARRASEVVRILAEAGLLHRLVGWAGEWGRFDRAFSGLSPQPAIARVGALAVASTEDADRLRERLRLSNAEHEVLATYAELLARLRSVPDLDRGEVRRLAASFGTAALTSSAAILAGEPRPVLTPDARTQLERYATGAEDAPVFPLTGADLLKRGLPPGPGIGRVLAAERRAWMAAGCPV